MVLIHNPYFTHTDEIWDRAPRLMMWGGALGALGLFAAERIPRLRKDVLTISQ